MKPEKIVFIGPECSGKTSLAQKFESELNIPFCSEFARKYAEELDRDLEPGDSAIIFSGQREAESKFMSSHGHREILLFDTNLLSSILYSQWYFGFIPQGQEEEFQGIHYDRYFLFYPDIPWKPEKARGEDRRLEMYEFFKRGLDSRDLDYTLVSGSLNKRFDLIRDTLKGI